MKTLLTTLLVFTLFSGYAQLEITSLSPNQNENYALIDQDIEITFNASIDATTLADNIIVTSAVKGALPFSVSGGGTAVITVNPTNDFLYGDRIQVTLTESIESTGSDPLTNGFSFTFRVKTLPAYSTPLSLAKLVTSIGAGATQIADIEGDDDLDILGGNYGNMRWYENDGDENFSYGASDEVYDANPTTIQVGDINSDGYPDVLGVSNYFNYVNWYENDGTGSFSENVIVNSGYAPYAADVADLNGDGWNDIGVATNGGGVVLYINSGSGTYIPQNMSETHANGRAVTFSDIDGDGDMDILCQPLGSNTRFAWYENDGALSFTEHFIDGNGYGFNTEFQVVDLDDDGDLDLITTFHNNDWLLWYENDGSQSFTKHTIINSAEVMHNPSVGDVDGDGDMDVFAADNVGKAILWFENDGLENFTERTLCADIIRPYISDLVDLNLDGRLDLVGTGNEKIIWFENKTNESPVLDNPLADQVAQSYLTFSYLVPSDAFSDPELSTLSYSAALSNDDPLPDWLTFDPESRNLSGIPTATDVGTISVKIIATDPGGLSTDDVIDIVISPTSLMTIDDHSPTHQSRGIVASSNISITFSESIDATTLNIQHFQVIGSMSGLVSGAFSGGGTPNIIFDPTNDFFPGEAVNVKILTTLTSQGGSIVVENNTFSFVVGAAVSPSSPALIVGSTELSAGANAEKLKMIDLDGDGDLDILNGIDTGNIEWYENDGDGNFTATTIDNSGSSLGFDIGDIDLDGDLDLVTARRPTIQWVENDGNETFSSHSITTDLDFIGSVILSDINGDGYLDVIVWEINSEGIWWLKNDGAGNFTQIELGVLTQMTETVLPVDLDQDGDMDLVAGGHVYASNTLVWFENDGFQNFTQHQITTDADGVSDLDVADVDGDGDLDLLTAENREDHVVIYQNDGNQVFTDTNIFEGTDGPSFARFVDIDADGDLDIITSAADIKEVGWLENKGSLDFTYWHIADKEGYSMVFGDVDSDGDLDFAAISTVDSDITIYENVVNQTPVVDTPKEDEEVIGDVAFSISVDDIFVDPDGSDVFVYSMTLDNGDPLPGWMAFSNETRLLTGTAPLSAESEYSLKVRGTDHAGEYAEDVFELSVTLPALISINSFSPSLATYNDTDVIVSIVFDKTVETTTLDDAIIVRNSKGLRVSGVISGGGTATISFTPDDALLNNEEYRVLVSSDIESEDGGISVSAYSFFFYTNADISGAFFQKQPTIAQPIDPTSIDLGDMNGNGVNDIIASSVSSGIGISVNWLDVESRATTTATNLNTQATHSIVYDMDQDGDLDIVSVWSLSNAIKIDSNDGTGSFTSSNLITGVSGANDFSLLDMDFDGDIDVIVPSDNSLDYYENDGTLNFTKHHLSNDDHTNVTVADLDLDGDYDVLGSGGEWYENDGFQSFESHEGFEFKEAAVVDIDQDGDMDIVRLHYSSDLEILYNDGTLTFTTETIFDDNFEDFKVADIDADGDLDLVVASQTTNSLFYLENNGDDTFDTQLLSGQELGIQRLQVSDINGDGRLDILTSNYNADEIGYFKNRNNTVPTIANALSNLETNEDAEFSFSIPSETFEDADSDELTLSVTLTDDSDIPDWLSFDDSDNSLSGTPLQANVGTIAIKVSADDGAGGNVSDEFDLTILNVNDAPTVSSSITKKTAIVNALFSYEVAEATFTDEDGDELTMTASLDDDSELPEWLTFDTETNTFEGTPVVDDVAEFDVKLIATDPNDASVTTEFTIEVSIQNDAPIVANEIEDLETDEDDLFEFSIDENTFSDADEDELTYSISLSDDSDLPEWLIFDEETLNFSGTPRQDNTGVLMIKLTAQDEFASVSTTFSLTINEVNDAPYLASGLSDIEVDAGATVSKVLTGHFSDEEDEELSYSVTLADGEDLPDWLTYDEETKTLSGISSESVVGDWDIKVTGTDVGELTVSDIFEISVISTNQSPVNANPLSDQTVFIDIVSTIDISTVFEDADDEVLVYTVTYNTGSTVPEWMSIEGDVFTINPPTGSVGDYSIRFEATDSHGASVYSYVDIEIAKQSQLITFSDLTTKTYGDEEFDLTAVANSELAISYSSSNSSVATVSGSTVTIIAAGTTTITASQTGDEIYNPATAVEQVLTVNKTEQTITFAEIANIDIAIGSVALDATANSGLTVTYELTAGDGSIEDGTLTVNTTGTFTIIASQAGNDNYLAAESVSQSFEVTSPSKSDQTITFTTLEEKTFGDEAFDLTATADSELEVTYTSSDENVATVSGSTVTIVGAGTTTITAIQTGDEIYNPATAVEQVLTVNKAEQTITFAEIADIDITIGSVALNATANSGLAVTYELTAGDGSIDDGTLTVNATGTFTITASQAGNDNYLAAESVSQSFEVTDASKSDQIITFTALEEKTFGDEAFDLTATADSELDVTYTSSDENVATISGSTITIVGAGTTTITATQTGDETYNPATAVEQVLTVNKAEQTISFTEIADIDIAVGSVALDATANSGLAVTYELTAGDGSIDDGTLTVNATGTFTIEASQVGNNNYLAAESVSRTFKVTDATKTSQTISFQSIKDQTYGNEVNLSATATSNLPVVFELIAGQGSITESSLQISGVGQYIVRAIQDGDNEFQSAIAVEHSFNVSKATLNFEAEDIILDQGSSFPEFTYNISGFKLGDTIDDLDELPTLETNAETSDITGQFDLLLTGGTDTHYDYNLVNGILTIKLVLSVSNENVTVSIYPNPSDKVITIETELDQAEMKLFNLNGELIKTIQHRGGTEILNIADLDSGIYFVQLLNEETRVIKRLIVKH
ncbi:Por secretion system C-terminal sorting domain-containing protein [Reichenbachiella agariperforans]|uniref:Por secretion system C-terminal sorting domain-containing protein n=1 Tax=Reichenbachiella agariperforans TaxID=156994 RepID=A0A1M6PUG0_REIAG|nr:FG-GAP-like repeat-containing protein [Reichenbachiella agariperforans]SHK11623.1 Por secretion system C-terminal sorting domain-containing protein [Reichenbachiella agariperforans]